MVLSERPYEPIARNTNHDIVSKLKGLGKQMLVTGMQHIESPAECDKLVTATRRGQTWESGL